MSDGFSKEEKTAMRAAAAERRRKFTPEQHAEELLDVIDANLDDGPMWATGFALVDMTPEVEKRITDMVSRAVGD